MDWINVLWWMVGGGCVLTGLIQMVMVLSGPAERRGRVVVGIVLIVLGSFCLVMPMFGEGAPPPDRPEAGATEPDSRASLDALALDELLSRAGREAGAFDPAHVELIGRLAKLSSDDAARVLAWCVDGDRSAVPPSGAWQACYGSVLEAMYTVRIPLDIPLPAGHAVLDLPVTYDVTHRQRWPSDVQPTISLTTSHWWPPAYGVVAQLKSQGDGMPLRPAGVRTWQLEVGEVQGDQEYAVDVELLRVRLDGASEREVVVNDVIIVDLSVGGTVTDVLPPVSSPAMNRMLRDRVRVDLVERPDGPVLRIDPTATATTLFDNIGLGMFVDVELGGAALCTLETWWPGGADGSTRPVWIQLPDDVGQTCLEHRDELTVRFRSNPEIALRCPRATRHWAGDVRTDVHVVEARTILPDHDHRPL